MDTNYEMSYYNYGITLSAEGVVPSFKQQEGGKDSHEYVDLGLPSGTLWATTNIQDADGNELYFAWGETQGYTASQVGIDKMFENDYEFNNNTKYNNNDGKTILDPEDDAAAVNWGSNWRMPTKEEFAEFTANTISAWTEVDGVQGAKFTSTVDGYTDKFLFFPAVGSAGMGQVKDVGVYSFCYSCSLDSGFITNAWGLLSRSNKCQLSKNSRRFGASVRPVR